MNTIGTSTTSTVWRSKYFSSTMQKVLRRALIAEKICKVDRSGSFYLKNPYGGQPTATIQAIASAGTYAVSAYTTTDDNCTVTDEIIYSEHIYGFEKKMANFNLMAERMEELAHAVKTGIDKFVLNNLLDDAGESYDASTGGGFTTPSNVPVIFSQIMSKLAGYESVGRMYVVLENTDLVGVIQAQFASGFNYADAALNNGLVGHVGEVEIYVTRSGTFVTDTLGSTSVVCANHRVAGISGAASVLIPEFEYQEKPVSAKTGTEIVVATQVGFKLWTQNANLVIDITVA